MHLAHSFEVKGFAYRRVKNDVRDAADLADLLRMGRLPEAYGPPAVRELRELVRYRAKLVAWRSGGHPWRPAHRRWLTGTRARIGKRRGRNIAAVRRR